MAGKGEEDLGRKKGTGQTSRGPNKKEECPFCHKFYGNVKNHIAMKHQTEGPGGQAKGVEITREKLLGLAEPKAKEKVYYCQACRAELREGENPCWNCGELMAWELVK